MYHYQLDITFILNEIYAEIDIKYFRAVNYELQSL